MATCMNFDCLGFFWAAFSSEGFFWRFLEKVLPVFVGAVLAFYFGLSAQARNKRRENMAYLQYAIASLTSIRGGFYNFKDQVVKARYEEALSNLEVLKGGNGGRLNIVETGKYMYGGAFAPSFSIEKMDFLVSRDPNLIVILGAFFDSVQTLSHMVSDVNDEVKTYSWNNDEATFPRLLLSLEKNKILYEQLDVCIYFSDKILPLLIKFGSLEYGKKMKIKSVVLTDAKYEALKPMPIESWESCQWFEHKKSPS